MAALHAEGSQMPGRTGIAAAACAALAGLAAPAEAAPPSYAEFCRVITAAAAASPGRFEAVKAAPHEAGFATTLRPADEADGFHCAIQPAGERPLMLACVAYVRADGLDGWAHECLAGWRRDTDGEEVAFFAPEARRTLVVIAPYRGGPYASTIAILEAPGPTT